MDLQEGAQRHHLIQFIADIQVLNIIRLQAVGSIGLDVYLEHLVELVKEINKGRTQIGLQGFKNTVQGDLQGSDLGPVNVQIELGAAGAEGGGQVAQTGLRITGA